MGNKLTQSLFITVILKMIFILSVPKVGDYDLDIDEGRLR